MGNLQKYEVFQEEVEISFKEIEQLSQLKPDEVIATNEAGDELSLNKIKKQFKTESLEKAKLQFPTSFDDFKAYLAPYMETISTYSINRTFVDLFQNNLLPELSTAFVPINIRSQCNKAGDTYICHLSLRSQQERIMSVSNINYMKDGLSNEAIFLNENAVRTAMVKEEGDLGNAYLCLENGYIKDIRFSTTNCEHHYGSHIKELLEIIKSLQEKDKLLANIPAAENEPTSSIGSRPKVKI